MYTIIVKGRDFYNLKDVPVAGVTNLLVQGEIGIPINFVFNTNSEHDALKNLSFQAWYKRRDGQGLNVPLGNPTINEDGTFTVTWTPDKHVTYYNGALAFSLAAYYESSMIWKTKACAVTVAKSVDPQIIDPDEKYLSYEQLIIQLEAWVTAQKGVANGFATLGEDGRVPASQLDLGTLDNFEMGYYYNGSFYKDAEHTSVMTPKEEAIYIDKSTSPATLYVYNGTSFEKIADEANIYTKKQVDDFLATKVDKIEGKGLSVEDFTTAFKTKLDNLPDRATYDSDLKSINDDIDALDNAKVDKIEGSGLVPDTKVESYDEHIANTDIHVTTDNKDAWNAKYDKPVNGIPKTDMTSAVQTTLGLADTSVQEIQKNGTTVEKKNGIVNISIPVDADDVSALPDTTKYGSTIEVSIDNTTYVCTFKLKDQDGNLLGTEQTIDLPLETMVVSGSYDSKTKTLKLELKNGQTIEIPIEDVISGLVTASDLAEILTYYYKITDADAKFQTLENLVTTLDNADKTHYPSAKLTKDELDKKVDKVSGSSLVPDTKVSAYDTHVADTDIHVTASDKTAWNAKYDKPSTGIPKTDLASDVQTSLGKADSALQEHQDISGKVDKVAGSSLVEDTKVESYDEHLADTDIHVTTANKEAWNAKYDKPSEGIPKTDLSGGVQASLDLADSAYQKAGTGIPKADLASDVQSSLGKADTALQEHQPLSDYRKATDQDTIDETKVDKVSGSSLVPDTKVAAYDAHVADGTIHVTTDNKNAWNAKYDKPTTGIPKTDLSEDVQTSLGKADTALQEHQSLEAYSLTSETGYRVNLEIDPDTFVVTPKLLDKNGNLISTGTAIDLPLESVVVSGSYDTTNKKIVLTLKNGSTVDVPIGDLITGLATQEWVEKKGYYTKPSDGIPKTDLAESVQTSLGLADSALQTHQDISGKVDKVTGSSLVPDTKVTSYDTHIADDDIHVTTDDKDAWSAKYDKPEGGIPSTDLAESYYLASNPSGFTSNVGTVTGITMNGSSMGTSGDVNLGTVITSHQSLEAYRTSADQDTIDAKKYEKPADGIPSSDMTEAVQTSLGKADTALQEHQSLSAYRTSADQDKIDAGKVDKVTGKGLSTNDYDDTEKQNVADNTTARHSHANKSELDLIASGDKKKWDDHVADTSNPHGVTAAQVGLGNVDNTSDANKPVSSATQTALDAKVDTTTFNERLGVSLTLTSEGLLHIEEV